MQLLKLFIATIAVEAFAHKGPELQPGVEKTLAQLHQENELFFVLLKDYLLPRRIGFFATQITFNKTELSE